MWVLLVILKWIGIILGGILALSLLCSALILFVPVRYRVQGSNRQGVVYSFRVHWLLSIVSIRKKKKSEKVMLKVFGIPIKCLSGGEQKKRKKPVAKTKSSSVSKKTKEKQEDEQKTKEEKQKKKKFFSFDKLSSIIGLVKDKRNRNVLKRIFRECRQLIKYIAPTKIRGEMLLGTGDPCTTGLVFGGISLFPLAYEDGVRLIPCFEEKCFEAEGYVKGKMRAIYFLRLILRLYSDREIKRLWKQVNRIKKEAA